MAPYILCRRPGWDLLRAWTMTIDGQNLLKWPTLDFLLLLTETLSIFRTRPYTWKLCIYQKLALALTIPLNQFRINSKKRGKLMSMSFSPKIGCIAHLGKTGKSCPPFPPWPLLRVGSRQGLVALQLFTRQEECQSRHSSAELHYYRFNLPVLHYIDKLLVGGRVLCHLCIP